MNEIFNIKEIVFLKKTVPEIFKKYCNSNLVISHKSKFDLVTTLDKEIEKALIEQIKQAFPNDKILSEETLFEESIDKRTWTIDPIDGTVNMANNIGLFGIQLSLVENNEVITSYMYFPSTNDEYFAVKGLGCYKNNQQVYVNKNVKENDAIISFGDYLHQSETLAKLQHKSIGFLYPKIAKIRMFGASSIDFSLVASGQTSACVITTAIKNLWDFLPGLLLCKEAGAIITNLTGDKYKIGDSALIASCNESISNLILKSLKNN